MGYMLSPVPKFLSAQMALVTKMKQSGIEESKGNEKIGADNGIEGKERV